MAVLLARVPYCRRARRVHRAAPVITGIVARTAASGTAVMFVARLGTTAVLAIVAAGFRW